MKAFFALLILSLSLFQAAQAQWTVSEYWDQDNSPRLKFVCDKYDVLCNQLCSSSSVCEIKQVVCRDCIGTSILMTNIFEGMGTFYRSTGESINAYEFVDFIKRGMYVIFSSKSIYNQADSYDSDALKAKFLSLCPSDTQNSLVFFSLKTSSNVLEEVKYVICDSKIFGMSDNPDIVLNDKAFLRMNSQLRAYRFR